MPPPKRQRVETLKEEATHAEPQPQLPQLPKQEPPKRESILSYFKRLPSSSSVPAVPSSDPVEPALTPPPSSPVPISNARKRRRLTTRPNIAEEVGLVVKSIHLVPKDKNTAEEQRLQSGLRGDQNDEPLSVSTTNHQRNPFSETTPSKLNTLEAVAPTKGSVGSQKKVGKRPAKDMVQTTLNISLNPDSGFTICKDCGTLYNPLNEKDRKEHKKQHAAHVRSKAKRSIAGSP